MNLQKNKRRFVFLLVVTQYLINIHFLIYIIVNQCVI